MIFALDQFRLSRLDDEGALQATLEIGGAMEHDSSQFVVGAGAVWVAAGHVSLFRVERDRVSKTFDIGYHLDGLAASDDAVFVSNDRRGGRIYRIDPRDNRIDLAVAQHGHQLRYGGDALWASWNNTVRCIDPKSLQVATAFDLGGYVSEMAWGLGALWAVTLDNDTAGSDDERSRLWRIDDQPHELAQLKDRPTIAVGDAVWLSDATLCRWDDALIRYEAQLRPMIARNGEVWGIDAEGQIARFRNGRLESLGLRAHALAAQFLIG